MPSGKPGGERRANPEAFAELHRVGSRVNLPTDTTMKRTTKSSDFRIASSDMSHRTLKEIQKGEPKRKPVPYQPGLTGSKPISTISSFDFEAGKKQAEKLMAAQQAAKLKAALKP